MMTLCAKSYAKYTNAALLKYYKKSIPLANELILDFHKSVTQENHFTNGFTRHLKTTSRLTSPSVLNPCGTASKIHTQAFSFFRARSACRVLSQNPSVSYDGRYIFSKCLQTSLNDGFSSLDVIHESSTIPIAPVSSNISASIRTTSSSGVVALICVLQITAKKAVPNNPANTFFGCSAKSWKMQSDKIQSVRRINPQCIRDRPFCGHSAFLPYWNILRCCFMICK